MTRGPRPKDNAVRRNTHPFSQSLSNEAQSGRELPKALGITTAGARRFWRTWASSPQTARWAETDWSELEITTKLVDGFYTGDLKLAGEIRQRVAKWGATVEDRSRLRMAIEDDDQAPGQEAGSGPAADPSADLDAELYRLLNGDD